MYFLKFYFVAITAVPEIAASYFPPSSFSTSCQLLYIIASMPNIYSSDCACNPGGSQNNNCDKESGQCSCKPGLDGRQCDQ